MTEQDIAQICSWVERGAKLALATHHTGRRRLKIYRGPFGLIKHEYRCESDDLRVLSTRLMADKAVH
jgi:hypothetical protein